MRMRADEALVVAGLCEDIRLAQSLIMEGKALYGSQKLLKPSESINKPELLRLKGSERDFVSRGAYKLKKAFEVFDISALNKNCIDVGASTGGFTDVMLKNGASRVFAIDVGYNLLDWKLRRDPKVTVMEKTNARFLSKENFDCEITFGATDVSFISLKLVLPAIFNILSPDADFIALVKPQFEAAKYEVGDKGVVRDSKVHKKVLDDIISFALSSDIGVYGIDYSPIKGPEGNIEFLLHLRNDEKGVFAATGSVNDVVDTAHVILC